MKTNLLGEYVKIPGEGDAGWVRAVWDGRSGNLYVLVQRDNVSNDAKIYLANELIFITKGNNE